MKLEELTPFVSLIVAEARERAPRMADLLANLTAWLKERAPIGAIDASDPVNVQGGFSIGRITYQEQRPPPWTSSADLLDLTHHLFLVCSRKNKIAFYASDPALLRQLHTFLEEEAAEPWGLLRKIPPTRLNAAFIRNRTVTLWLSGLHRRTDTKVDNKVITGSNLRYALDPLGDQTFTFTAARSKMQLGRARECSIGVAPRKSSVWTGPSAGLVDFLSQVGKIFDAIPDKKGDPAPLPCLAIDVQPATELPLVKDAFDASLASVEAFEQELAPEARRQLEEWSDVALRFRSTKGSSFKADVLWPGPNGHDLVGQLEVVLKVDGEELNVETHWTADKAAPAEKRDEAAKLMAALQTRRDLLKVWYDSGHVLAGHALHRLQFREFPFDRFEWVDFSGYHVTREKPVPLQTKNIGRGGSLFCWVFNEWKPNGKDRWKGWLACTDGAMEMADFIHLDDSGAAPEITFIHAKGADSDQPDRQISVSAYEIVVSQAVKNLRHLDPEIMAGRFLDKIDGRIADAVWHDGSLVRREEMLAAVRRAGFRFHRRVIVLQPHARKTLVTAPQGRADRSATRAAQLHTLLLAAQANCRSLGAEFSVIADQL